MAYLGLDFHSFVHFFVILPFKMVLKHKTEVLASVYKCKKAVMCLTKKSRVSNKLHSGRSSFLLAMSSVLMSQKYY